MANKDNIALLSKYQMRVLYYKCREGATHEQIAVYLGRDVNTVQYHMTKIYTVLEIRKPGKSREEMESELLNEIGPLIRQMFNSYDDLKTWAPVLRERPQEEEEDPRPEMEEPAPYIPPPSVQRVLESVESQPVPPVILAPPPPGRRRVNRRLMVTTGLVIGLLALGFLFWMLWLFGPGRIKPTPTPQPVSSPTAPLPDLPAPVPTEAPASAPLPSPTPTFTIQVRIVPADGMMQVFVPAGRFVMGSSRAQDPQVLDEETPQHIVSLGDYWIDRMEVSNAQYALCVADGACTTPVRASSITRESYYGSSEYADYPVLLVSWSQASAYCAWAGRRLPSEAEWEKAARGPDARLYPWGNTFDGTLANYCDHNCWNGWKDDRFDDGYYDTAPVGEYPGGASYYGALDMVGNAYEWVADWFAPYSTDPQTNPTGPASGQDKTIRGGSWGDDAVHIRAAVRSRINPESWLDFIGFRCASNPD